VVEQQYWVIGHAGTDEGGRPHPAERVLSVPWWPEAMKYTHEEGNERVDAPILFTTEEAAEVQLRMTEEAEPDSYLKLVNQHGEQREQGVHQHSSPNHTWHKPGCVCGQAWRFGFLMRSGGWSDETPAGLH